MNRTLTLVRHPVVVSGMSLVVFLALAGCFRNTPTSLVVPLAYTPTNTADLATYTGRISSTARIYVAPVADNRSDTTIGANKENKLPVPIYGSSQPAQFVHDAIIANLHSVGANVVNDKSSSNYTLEMSLQRFWVEESPSYHGTIVVHTTLLDTRGAVKWEGTVAGTNDRFGRSLKVENYQQTFSDCVISLVEKLLENDAFVAQLNRS